MIAPESELWGQRLYSDKTPVPKAQFRCTSSESPNSIAHVCKLHQSHTGRHACICGKTWTVESGAVAS